MRRRSQKREGKIDPNWFGDEISSKTHDLLSVITNRAMSWLFTSRWYQIKKYMNLKTDLVKGRRENVIPKTGKGRLLVVGIKNIKKRPTTDHLPHIKEKATSVKETKVKSTHDQRNASYRSSFRPKKLHDRFETIYRTYLSHREFWPSLCKIVRSSVILLA